MKTRNLIYRIILTILSVLSSGFIFFSLYKQVQFNKMEKTPQDPITFAVIFGIMMLLIGILSCFLKNKWIKVIEIFCIVACFSMTICSLLAGWPTELFLLPNMTMSGSYMIGAILVLNCIWGMIYFNLDHFNRPIGVLNFCLKFLVTLIAALIALYIIIFIMTSGATFLAMPTFEQTVSLLLMFIWSLLNLVYGAFIWLKPFRGWLAWLFSGLVAFELLIPIIYILAIGMFQLEWGTVLALIVMAMIVLGMTYLNNRLAEKEFNTEKSRV